MARISGSLMSGDNELDNCGTYWLQLIFSSPLMLAAIGANSMIQMQDLGIDSAFFMVVTTLTQSPCGVGVVYCTKITARLANERLNVGLLIHLSLQPELITTSRMKPPLLSFLSGSQTTDQTIKH